MKWRMISIFIMFSLLLFALVVRLAFIQILHGHEYRQQVRNQSYSYLSEIPVRGTIYDRNNKPLTNSSEGLLLLIERTKINDEVKEILRSLKASPINGSEKKHRLFLVDSMDISNIEKMLKGHGVVFMKHYKYMPELQAVSHILGSVNPLDNSGASGIEKDYDHILDSGKAVFAVRKDGLGNLIHGEGINIDGDDRTFGVITTIDFGIQKSIEEILFRNSAKGAIIVTEINSGEILASASSPSYMPDEIKYYSAKDERFINKASSKAYRAGAVYDVILTAAEVEKAIAASNVYMTKDHFYEDYNSSIYASNEEIIEMIENLCFSEKPIIGYSEQISGNLEEFQREIGKLGIDGHNDLFITPMQVARMNNIIAAGGIDRGLTLIKGTIEGVKGVHYYPKRQEKQMMSEETAKILEQYSAGFNDILDVRIVNDKNWSSGFMAKGKHVYGITIYVENPSNTIGYADFIYDKVIEELKN